MDGEFQCRCIDGRIYQCRITGNRSADSLDEIDKALIGFANELSYHRPDEIADTRFAQYHSAYRYVKTFLYIYELKGS